MAEESGGEKTEKPSAKRLKDAHERGQVPRSQDVVAAVALLAVTSVMAWSGAAGLARMQDRLADGLRRLGDAPPETIGAGTLSSQIVADLTMFGLVCGPVLLTALIVGVAGNLAQSGWVFAPSRLALDFTRLGPANGLQRLKPAQSGINVLKALGIAAVVGWLSYLVIRDAIGDAPRLAWMTSGAAAVDGWRRMTSLLQQTGIALLFFAGFDYGVQRWRHYTSLKMTRQELKDEAKSNEGNLELKGRIRRVQRDMTRRRMLSAVPAATVVITNPTHYAVAIKYDRAAMSAPIVVAKGRDHLALKIKAIARDKGVPIVENVPLARALYASVEVDEVIPKAHFEAAAKVIGFVFQSRRRR